MATARYINWTKPNLGHAALIINLEHLKNSEMSHHGVPLGMMGLNHYVSWFGSSQGLWSHGVCHTYVDDFDHFGRKPDRFIDIPNLDEDAMFSEWYNIRTKKCAHWKLIDKNCSTVVVRVLKAGGADRFCPSLSKRNAIVWTPDAAYTYAESVGRHATGG